MPALSPGEKLVASSLSELEYTEEQGAAMLAAGAAVD